MDGSSSMAQWTRWVRVLRRASGDDSAAEDFVQDAYVRMLEYGQRHEVRNPDSFVLHAARNLVITAHRRKKRHSAALADCAVKVILQLASAPQDEVIAARESLAIAQRAIDNLSPRARTVFVMHRIDGMTYSEIARALAISVSAVEKNMARALTALTLELGELKRGR